MSNIKTRDIKLDFLRVLAIIECIAAHALMGENMSADSYHWLMIYMPDTAAVFIMASGAIILNREQKCDWKYVGHRLIAFVPEFILFSLLYLYLNQYFGLSSSPRTTIEQIMYMFFTPTWSPGWFILALIGVYAVSPMLWAWVRAASKREVEIALACWLFATCLPAIAPHTQVDVPQSIFGTLFNYAGYMVMGYYLVRWPMTQRKTQFKVLFFAVCAAIGLVFNYYLGQSAMKWGYLANLTSGLSINVVMVSLLQFGIVLVLPDKLFRGRCAGVISGLSVLSLGIYCCHWGVIRYWSVENGVNWIAGTAAALLVSVPAAYILRKIRMAVQGCLRRTNAVRAGK